MVLADDLCINLDGDPVLAQMVKLYNQFRCSIVAIQEVPPEETSKYGVIAGEMIRDDIFRVSHMVESPSRKTPRRTWRSSAVTSSPRTSSS